MRVTSFFLSALLLAGNSAREDGMAAFHQGRYSVALTKLTEAAKDPRDKQASAFLALTEAAMGNCKEALPGLTAHATDPTIERLAGVAAAKCYAALGDEASASAQLQRLEKRFPNDADVLYVAAKLHMKAF